MRFGLMGRILAYQGYGVRTFFAGLLRGLAVQNSSHEFVVFILPGTPIPADLASAGFDFIEVPARLPGTPGRLIWDHFSTGNACRSHGIDVLYAPMHVRPIFAPCPVLVTIHDMLYHLFPKDWGWSDQLYFRAGVNLLTKRAAAVMTYSENTRRDVIRILQIPKRNVTMIYPGVPAGFSPRAESEQHAVCRKYSLDKPFILYVGSFHPRKNVPSIILAFERVADRIPHDLVIASLPIWNEAPTLEKIRRSPLAERIRFTGYIPHETLPALYSAADLFVFPSKYEGFGFPVLEALACGCATITSNSSSLTEVAGEAAVLVEPGNFDELGEAMVSILTQPSIQGELRRKGPEQASGFSWEKTGSEFVTLLEKVADG